MKKMKHYWFESESAGEFIVGADSLKEAEKIIESERLDATHNRHFYGTLTDVEAEMTGLDEY